MASYLTKDALFHLNEHEELQKEVYEFTGLTWEGFKPAIYRESRALTTWKAVEIISKHMGKTPEEILIEK